MHTKYTIQQQKITLKLNHYITYNVFHSNGKTKYFRRMILDRILSG